MLTWLVLALPPRRQARAAPGDAAKPNAWYRDTLTELLERGGHAGNVILVAST